jgi:hypothetical protein
LAEWRNALLEIWIQWTTNGRGLSGHSHLADVTVVAAEVAALTAQAVLLEHGHVGPLTAAMAADPGPDGPGWGFFLFSAAARVLALRGHLRRSTRT